MTAHCAQQWPSYCVISVAWFGAGEFSLDLVKAALLLSATGEDVRAQIRDSSYERQK
ncbi:hypothetical protein IRJ41_009338, partial [Triplophysa rosa]